MNRYYADNLASERLKRCYEMAPPRVKQYLAAEIEFVLGRIKPADEVLELGCGYGRVLFPLLDKVRTVVGIDTSLKSLVSAKQMLPPGDSWELMNMDAGFLGFKDQTFEVVVCIQNGLSAFSIDRRALIEEALRVTKTGGKALFSSYSARFWEERLFWFRLQADHGLIGEIDEEKTGEGVIVCKDGFQASTIGQEEFLSLTSGLGVHITITEVDGSSLFCEICV
jgi:SAM-dependent methyltransferase